MVDVLTGLSSLTSLGFRVFDQSPLTPDTGVRAGAIQRQVNLRLDIDLIDVQVVSPTTASRTTLAQVRGALQTVADDFNLPALSNTVPDSLTPTAVAGRIVDYARSFLDQASTVTEYNDIYEAVLEGIDAGFAQAPDILDELIALNGENLQTIDETRQLVDSAVARLADAPEGLLPASVVSVTLPDREDL